MALYDRILVPTDGSPKGARVVAHALDIAAVHDASVHALHVVDTASYAGMPMEGSWEGVDKLLRSDARNAVTRIEEIAAATSVDIETAVVDGSPSREIIRYAEENDCDLIVMGTHGRGGINRLLLGSVTEKVVRGASVPVLTMRLDGHVPEGMASEAMADEAMAASNGEAGGAETGGETPDRTTSDRTTSEESATGGA